MSRVFNMRAYLLSLLKAFFWSPWSLSTPCFGSASLHISLKVVFVVIAQGITRHHFLVIVNVS